MSESTVLEDIVNNETLSVPEKLEALKHELSKVAKQKLECFQGLRKTLSQTPRVQEQVDDAHERYFQACRDVEEIEANMSRVTRGVSS